MTCFIIEKNDNIYIFLKDQLRMYKGIGNKEIREEPNSNSNNNKLSPGETTCLLDSRIRCGSCNSTLVIFTGNLEIAFLSPTVTPAILDKPVILVTKES